MTPGAALRCGLSARARLRRSPLEGARSFLPADVREATVPEFMPPID
jgi:hypothetical protein